MNPIIKKTTPGKIDLIDFIKGFSILSVVWFHIAGQIYGVPETHWVRILGYQGVQFFFLLSGFGCAYSILRSDQTEYSYSFWISWAKKRFLRIYPLYFTILAITTVFASLSGSNVIKIAGPPNHASWNVVAHIFMIHVYDITTFWSLNVAWWYVGVIFLFYLVFPLLYAVVVRNQSTLILFLLSAIIYFLLIAGTIMLFGEVDVSAKQYRNILLNQFLTGLFLFFQGILLAKTVYSNGHWTIGKKSLSMMAASLLLVATSVTILKSQRSGVAFYSVWLVLTFSFFLFVCMLYFSFQTIAGSTLFFKWFIASIKECGINSYAIYLTHWGLIVPIVSRFHWKLAGIIVYMSTALFIGLIFTKIDHGLLQRLTTPRRITNTA